jgi:3'-phosphoadenosine 5'-phosphosulfate sulfotransferase (PAPS reductase)/FAD synthetase
MFGGGRRDEEKARAKERVYSHRDEFGQWDPKNQRPELWSLYNGRLHEGEHMRIFPISNWTELDIWDYIGRERIEIPSIYFSHQRRVFERDGCCPRASSTPARGERRERIVRFRTVPRRPPTAAWSPRPHDRRSSRRSRWPGSRPALPAVSPAPGGRKDNREQAEGTSMDLLRAATGLGRRRCRS